MPLLHFFSGLRTDDSLILRVFGEGEYAASTRKVTGTAGVVGTLLIFFAILSMFWAGLDPAVDIRSVFAYSVELLGGLALAMGFGFKFARRTNLKIEVRDVALGLLAGVIILAIHNGIFAVSGLLPYSLGSAWLILLAPVAETMLFNVAFYHLFKTHFPELSWLQIAVTSDVSFAMYHFFAYGGRPDFWLVLIILLIGNTMLMYVYHLTKNASAPMVAHLVVNLAVVQDEVISALLANVGTLVALFMVFVLLYLLLGRFRQQ